MTDRIHHCLFAVAAILVATVPLALQTRVFAITAVNVIDVADGRIVPNATVTIDDTTITSVTPDGTLPSSNFRIDSSMPFTVAFR